LCHYGGPQRQEVGEKSSRVSSGAPNASIPVVTWTSRMELLKGLACKEMCDRVAVGDGDVDPNVGEAGSGGLRAHFEIIIEGRSVFGSEPFLC